MSRILFITLFALLLLVPVAQADFDKAQVPSQVGLFFTIENGCESAANGFAVGDELCIKKIDTAWFMSTVFQGDLGAGESKSVTACANTDNAAVVLFVPAPGSGAQAVRMTVQANSTVQVPSSYCGNTGDENVKEQLRHD